MNLETIFTRYGSPSKEAEIRITGYLLHPSSLTVDRIPRNDDQAARIIKDCENTIAVLKEYRQALAARYAQLEISPYALRLELKRHPAWSVRGVTFDLCLIRRYEDRTEVMELHEHYTGKQRREAIARFETLRRQRPGIEAVKDIEKKQWEK